MMIILQVSINKEIFNRDLNHDRNEAGLKKSKSFKTKKNNVYFKCYFSRGHIALSYKRRCEHRIRKTNILRALCMMQNNILNKQTTCQ